MRQFMSILCAFERATRLLKVMKNENATILKLFICADPRYVTSAEAKHR